MWSIAVERKSCSRALFKGFPQSANKLFPHTLTLLSASIKCAKSPVSASRGEGNMRHFPEFADPMAPLKFPQLWTHLWRSHSRSTPAVTFVASHVVRMEA